MSERANFGPADLDECEEVAGRVGPEPKFHAIARLPIGATLVVQEAAYKSLDRWCREGGAIIVGPDVLTLLVRDGDAWREV